MMEARLGAGRGAAVSRFGGVALAAAFVVIAAVVLIWFPADEEQGPEYLFKEYG